VSKIKVWVKGKLNMYQLMLPSKKIVCSRCRGSGKHVNPNIDGHGITSDEMEELGRDFQEDYLSGVYDVQCEECNGSNVIDVVDVDALTNKMRSRYNDALSEIHAIEMEAISEREWGA